MDPDDVDQRWLDPNLKQQLWDRYTLLLSFAGEVELQCTFVLMAWDQLRAAVPRMRAGNTAEVWFCVQNLLVAAADASKLIEAGGPDLRAVCDLKGNSPLLDRSLRNNLEHFASEWANWKKTTKWHNYFGRVIGHFGEGMTMATGRSFKAREVFHAFDPVTYVVTFHRDSAPLSDIAEQAGHSLDAIARWRGQMFTQVTKGMFPDLT